MSAKTRHAGIHSPFCDAILTTIWNSNLTQRRKELEPRSTLFGNSPVPSGDDGGFIGITWSWRLSFSRVCWNRACSLGWPSDLLQRAPEDGSARAVDTSSFLGARAEAPVSANEIATQTIPSPVHCDATPAPANTPSGPKLWPQGGYQKQEKGGGEGGSRREEEGRRVRALMRPTLPAIVKNSISRHPAGRGQWHARRQKCWTRAPLLGLYTKLGRMRRPWTAHPTVSASRVPKFQETRLRSSRHRESDGLLLVSSDNHM